jgi:hypothetical protein
LSASPEGLACTPLFQQPGILPAPSSPCHALLLPAPRCSGLESPFSMPCPRPLHDARSRRLPWHVDRKGVDGIVSMTRRSLDLNWYRCCLRCHACTTSQDCNFIRRAPPRPHVCPCFGSQALTIGGRPNSAKIYGINSTGSPCITTGERVAIFRIGFALRCFQRLSVTAWLPGAALSDNRCTRGRHRMFLSY